MTTHKAPTLLQNAGRTIVNGRRLNKRSRDELIMLAAAGSLLVAKRDGQMAALDAELIRMAKTQTSTQSSLRDALADLNTVRTQRDATLRELTSMEQARNAVLKSNATLTKDLNTAEEWIAEWEDGRWGVTFAWVVLAAVVGLAAFIWGCNVGTKWLAWVWDLL